MKKSIQKDDQTIVVFNSEDGKIQFNVNLHRDTVWLSQKQMSDIFEKDSDTIGVHIQNIYDSGELKQEATTEKSSVVQKEGSRVVKRQINTYSLDVIIAVGYRVNSMRGTQFRIWASSVLKDHLIQGYTKNQKRLQEKQLALDVQRTGDTFSNLIDNKGQTKLSEDATKLVSIYIGKTTDTETLIIKAHLLCERFLYQYVESRIKTSKQLHEARLSFRQLLRLARSYHQKSEMQWLWECLDKLNSIRNTYAHKLETESLNHLIDDFSKIVAIRFKTLGHEEPQGLKALLVTLAGLTFNGLGLSKNRG